MASVVSVCNLALVNVGKPTISDINERSTEARACKQFFSHALDTLLESYPWTVAGKTAAVAQKSVNEKNGLWRYAYELPTDCLKVRSIRPQYSQSEAFGRLYDMDDFGDEFRHTYEIEAETLYCNISPCLLRYTRRLPDPSQLTPSLIAALSWELAAMLAMPLTRDPKIRADAAQWGERYRIRAEVADAAQRRHSSDTVSEFIKVRRDV